MFVYEWAHMRESLFMQEQTFCALYFAVKLYKQQDNFKPWIFGFLVVLYNPIIPMPLGSKALWMIVNIPTIYYFFINRRS